jgi:hypothetical protein
MTTSVEISKLRPTFWYLERSKLEVIREVWRRGDESLLPPILVTYIDNEPTLIDGHCRAYVALINGATHIQAVSKNISETDNYYHLFYDIHQKCVGQGVLAIQDLENRIFDFVGTYVAAPTSNSSERASQNDK